MENDTKGFKGTEERLIEIKYIGLGGLEKAKRGTLMLFCPADLYETFMEDREHSRVPLLPVPVPPFSDGLYTRRLVAVAGGDDPDGDIFEGYTRVAGVRIKRITLRSAPQGIYGRMTVVTSEDEEAEVPINFEYTIVEAVLAGIPIFMEQSLFDYILSQIKVDARFPGEEDREQPEEEQPEEAESVEDYVARQIEAGTDPLIESPEVRNRLLDFEEDLLMRLLDLSLEKGAYDWTDFLKLILSLKKGGSEA
ncbi:MAG: hypothetical protein SOW44_02070 [Porphyromonas sp.]|nr:hypothetical protein [Bacteroidales bacterium]MDY3100115.1 hypothetical protein [Porphyromonas sp.]